MDFVPAGRWQWDGIFLPSENAAPEEQEEICIWADTIEEAVKEASLSLPEGSVLVMLSRGRDMTGESFTIDDDSPVAKTIKGNHIN